MPGNSIVPAPAAASEETDIAIKPPYVPPEPKTVFLGGIFALMVLAACIEAAAVLIPIVLAFMLKMVLFPVMRGFERLRVPRIAGALLIIVMLLGGVGAMGTVLTAPAIEWAQDMPRELPRIKARLHELRNPIEPIQRVLNDAQNLTIVETSNGMDRTMVTVREQPLPDRLMVAARKAGVGFLQTMVVLFFLLVSGDTFLRRLVEILPRFADKKQAITISNQIESDMSAYLRTITLMNAGVGVATGIIMHFCGIGDPVLWGMVAFLLNYIPVAGPIIGMGLFALVGLISETAAVAAFLPMVLYMTVHMIESQLVTPMLLARHFTINPVLVILGLGFFYWMWGIPGAILSTPILAMTKVVCDNIAKLRPFGHFIAG